MTPPDTLATQVRSIGFSCTGCGSCCRRTDGDEGLVMVTCAEVRAIMAATGLPWEEVAVPYPVPVDDGKGSVFFLGWCLRQVNGSCRFLSEGRCSVYENRPWICRTYPFMLDRDRLTVSACEGLGCPLGQQEAETIAADLLSRQSVEEDEERRIRNVLAHKAVPSHAVVDSEGVRVIHG